MTKDATSAEIEVPNYVQSLEHRSSLEGVKLGLPKEYFIEGLDPEVKQAVEAAVEHLKTLGAEIVEVSLPHANMPSPYTISSLRRRLLLIWPVLMESDMERAKISPI